MDVTDIVRKKGGCAEIDIIVSPNAPRSGIGGIDKWRKRVIIKVRAPPVEGKANREVASVFREITGCRSEVTAGMTSHQKTVTVFGDPEEIFGKIRTVHMV